MTLFHLSNLYLTGISVAWAVDSVVGLPVLGLALVSEPDAEPAVLTGSDAAQVERLREFVAGHGGRGTAVINYLGRVGARIVVVADDGAFGDAVASGVDGGRARSASRPGSRSRTAGTGSCRRRSHPARRTVARMAGTGR